MILLVPLRLELLRMAGLFRGAPKGTQPMVGLLGEGENGGQVEMNHEDRVMENHGASSSLQREDCAPTPADSISAEEVYAELNRRNPLIIGSNVIREAGEKIHFVRHWRGRPVNPPFPFRVLRQVSHAEYRAAVGRDSAFPHHHEIESVD